MQAGPPRYASQSPAMRPNYPQGPYSASPRPGFPQMAPGRMGMPGPGMSPHPPYAAGTPPPSTATKGTRMGLSLQGNNCFSQWNQCLWVPSVCGRRSHQSRSQPQPRRVTPGRLDPRSWGVTDWIESLKCRRSPCALSGTGPFVPFTASAGFDSLTDGQCLEGVRGVSRCGPGVDLSTAPAPAHVSLCPLLTFLIKTCS
ncbi:hypothetical protein RRG08_036781 [Elysia crispata]|uniref:Uncharacterized protein n=1 Tax=Elysia crispata TaxID=231223 RepID=A0AAE1ACX8_9GAST|nr:hypothetical protein RRG08_036781 [Elysia crispata]